MVGQARSVNTTDLCRNDPGQSHRSVWARFHLPARPGHNAYRCGWKSPYKVYTIRLRWFSQKGTSAPRGCPHCLKMEETGDEYDLQCFRDDHSAEPFSDAGP